jgi:sigma-B regulation protein RsbU (phosphoserine phosphatase)
MDSRRDSRKDSILVVDGSVQTTDLISYWLRMEELTISTAESGINALAKVDLFNPDIVISNVELPDISGFDLCKRIKTDENEQDTLVLLFSGLESDMFRVRAEEMGADDYIETSAEHYLFVSKVRSLLRVRRLSRQLRQKYAELEEKNHLLDMQLEMGMRVQRALIPDINTVIGECVLMSRYIPAMNVGGDFYNIITLNEDSFGIVMGDVSGHGIAAAFLTAMLNMMIKNLAPNYHDPDQLLFQLNNELYAMFEKSDYSHYACVFYAVVNTFERYVGYANAGQSLPLYVDAANNAVSELEVAGLPIGMMKDSRYEMKYIDFEKGDLLFLHTDGLQDAFYKDQPDEFTSRIKDVLSDIRANENLNEILDIVIDNFYRAASSEAKRMEMDDMSMILCRL